MELSSHIVPPVLTNTLPDLRSLDRRPNQHAPPVFPAAPPSRVRLAGLLARIGALLLLPTAEAATPDQTAFSAGELKTMSLEDLLEVQVISVSRSLEDWRTAPTAISVLTHDDIRRSGAVRMAEILRLAPGIHVGRDAGSGYAINARGFSSAVGNKMEVLLDGRSLYTPLFAGVSWNIQDTFLLDLDRVETVRGPGAVLWGANAVNGVINFVSKSADETQGLLVSGGSGTEEHGFAGIRYGGKLGLDSYYRAYFKHVSRDDAIFGNGASVGDSLRQSQGGFRLDSFLSPADHVTLQGDLYFDRTRRGARAPARYEGGNLLGRWQRSFADDSRLHVQTYYDRNVSNVPADFYEDRNTAELELTYRFPSLDRHQLVAGVVYRHSADETRNGRSYVFTPPSRTIRLFGGFAQDEITLLPERLTLTVGSKFENNDFTGFEMQPSVRLAFRPTPRQTLWTSISRAVRTPTRAEHDAYFRPDYTYPLILFRGDRSFDSETLVAFEAGYRVRPDENLFVDLAVFLNRYDNLRTFSSEPPDPTLILRNAREGDTAGAELMITWQPASWWRLTGSYSYLHEDLRFESGIVDPTAGFLETNDAPHTAKLTSAINLRNNVEVDLSFRYVDRLPFPYVPSYLELDVRLGWRPTEALELSLVGRNLLDASHPEFAATIMPVEIERGAYFQITWHH